MIIQSILNDRTNLKSIVLIVKQANRRDISNNYNYLFLKKAFFFQKLFMLFKQ